MRDRRRSRGFTLIEVMTVVAMIGVFAGLAAVAMRSSMGDMRAKGGARSLGDLLMLGRQEAMRTGDNYIVFYDRDAEDNALASKGGDPAAALLIRDLDQDGRVDSGEKVAAVLVDSTNSLSWGSTFAANEATPVKAPNDNAAAAFPEADPDFICCTFLDPDGNPARWVVFLPDGLPRSFKIGPFATGPIASGSGAVYVTSSTRDYAAVLAPLGGLRVHAYNNSGAGAWTN